MIWVGCVITWVASADLTTIHVEWYRQYPADCGLCSSKKSCDIHIPVHSERAEKTFAYTLQHALLWALLFVLLAHEQSRIESIHPFFTKPKLNGCQTMSNRGFAHQHGSLANNNWYLIEHAVQTSLRRLFCLFRDSMTIAGDDVHQTQSCFFLWICGRIELQ